MSHDAPLRRRLPALIAAASLVLLPALAQARPNESPRESRAALSLPQQAVAFVGSFWHALTSLWDESGMSIDPNGTPTTTTDGSGGSLDPTGQPGDEGASIDPWG